MSGALLLLLVTVFINIAGFSLILPLLPFYGHEMGASALQVAMLFSAYSFGNIFGESFWGRQSDARGRKPVLVLTMACSALAYVAFAYAQSYPAALAIRIVGGFFGGTLGVCQGFIADVTRPEARARSMAYFGASFNLGFALGPAIGGLLAVPNAGLAGFRPAIFAAAGLAGVACVWGLLVLANTRPGQVRSVPRYSEAVAFVRAHEIVRWLFLIAFVGIASFASMEAVFGLWTEHSFGWTSHEVGLAFLAVGGAGAFVQLVLVGPLVARLGEAYVIVLGLCCLIVGMVMQPILRLPLAAVLLMSLLMMGHGLAFPNAGALISRNAPRDRQGSVMGLLMASNALGRIAMPPLFGWLYATVSPDAPYFACALLVAAVIPLAFRVEKLRSHPPPA